MGEGLVFRWSAAHCIPRRRSPSGCQFCGFFSTYAYIIRPRTTKFGVVTHTVKGCFRRSSTSLHLLKCFARFAKDSWLFSCIVVSKFILYIMPQLIVQFLFPHFCTFQRWKSPPPVHTDDKIFIIIFLHFTITQRTNGALGLYMASMFNFWI